MNTNLHPDQRSVGTFGFKMARREHTRIAIAAQNNKLTLSGLIRGLLRQWHDGHAAIGDTNQNECITPQTRKKGSL